MVSDPDYEAYPLEYVFIYIYGVKGPKIILYYYYYLFIETSDLQISSPLLPI